MSLYTFIPSLLVVHHGSILVVGMVVDYLIVVGFSYHFDYPRKSRDVFRFLLLIGVCYPMILSICHVDCVVALFVTVISVWAEWEDGEGVMSFGAERRCEWRRMDYCEQRRGPNQSDVRTRMLWHSYALPGISPVLSDRRYHTKEVSRLHRRRRVCFSFTSSFY